VKNILAKFKRVEVWWKNAMIGLLSYYLKRSVRKTQKPDLNLPLKVLFVRPERLGDTFVSLPTVDALRKFHPNWEISWLTSPRSYKLVAEDPRFKNVYLYTKKPGDSLKILRRARRERFDVAINLIRGDSVTSLLLAHLMAPKAFKIGVGGRNHAPFYHAIVHNPYSLPNRHVIDSTLDIVAHLGANQYDAERFCRAYVSADRRRRVAKIMGDMGLGDGSRPLIGINISSGEETRTWDFGNFRIIIERLIALHEELEFMLIAAPNEHHKGIELAKVLGEKVHITPEPLDICSVAELLSRLNMFISADTSLVHITRSYRIPVVGLYRYNNLNTWVPYGQRSGAVMSGHEEHLFDITVEQVIAKTMEVGEKFKVPGFVLCPIPV